MCSNTWCPGHNRTTQKKQQPSIQPNHSQNKQINTEIKYVNTEALTCTRSSGRQEPGHPYTRVCEMCHCKCSLPAISKSDCDNNGGPGPQAYGVKLLESPPRVCVPSICSSADHFAAAPTTLWCHLIAAWLRAQYGRPQSGAREVDTQLLRWLWGWLASSGWLTL